MFQQKRALLPGKVFQTEGSFGSTKPILLVILADALLNASNEGSFRESTFTSSVVGAGYCSASGSIFFQSSHSAARMRKWAR